MVTSADNAAVKAARRLARARERGTTGDLLVEGPHAALAGLGHLRRLFVTSEAADREAGLVAAAEASGVDVCEVSPPLLASLATTTSPQGVVGVAHLDLASVEAVLGAGGLAVVLLDAREPGNVGAAIRTADAAGADGLVLAGTCADPRNAKAVRASAGSLFRLPVAVTGWNEVVAAAAVGGAWMVATAGSGSVVHTDVDLRARTAVVFGNEAHGLPDDAQQACDVVARIPLHGGAESLNLAAAVAVVAFEAARQRSATTDGPRRAHPQMAPT